jgi:hypothetical protein
MIRCPICPFPEICRSERSTNDTIVCEGLQTILSSDGARIPLSFWCDILSGEINMVIIIEDWDVLEEYAGEKIGFYQLLTMDGTVEIRVTTGRVGFKREFANSSDPIYNRILDFCRRSRYIKVSQTARDEQFFK